MPLSVTRVLCRLVRTSHSSDFLNLLDNVLFAFTLTFTSMHLWIYAASTDCFWQMRPGELLTGQAVSHVQERQALWMRSSRWNPKWLNNYSFWKMGLLSNCCVGYRCVGFHRACRMLIFKGNTGLGNEVRIKLFKILKIFLFLLKFCLSAAKLSSIAANLCLLSLCVKDFILIIFYHGFYIK